MVEEGLSQLGLPRLKVCCMILIAQLLLFTMYQSGVDVMAGFIFCLDNLLNLAEALSSDQWLRAKTCFLIIYYFFLVFTIKRVKDPITAYDEKQKNKDGEGEEEEEKEEV